jgi:protocadherin Fat 1/2/3
MEDFIMKSECQHIACKHGECRDELILSESDVISIIGNKLSFVSPFHEHRFGCACHPGFGGKLCEVIVNECARNPCPSFKECLPVSSPLGYLCQCPFGKSGPMCNQNAETCHSSDRDVSFCYEELNPISFHGNSYARYSFTKKVEKISLRFKSQQLRANIFTQTGDKSYNILEIAGGYIQYRFDCGSGEGLIRVENLVVSDGKWHEILVERKSNTASLTLDRKYRGGGFAPGITGCLDLNADLFFGGSVKPRSNAIGGEEISLGFIGCLDNILLNGHQIPLHMASTSSAAVLKTLANVEFSCNFKPDVGACKSQPCLNGGTCHNLINGSYQCVCVGPKYRGVNCEIDMSPCDTLPCMNGGLCRHDELLCKSGIANCYKCECGPSFTGLNCQVPRYCTSNLCQNGGVCEETSLGPKCHCHNGWHGLYCQYDIDECQLTTPVCLSPATCINIPGTFRCICPINATGISCNGDGLYTTNIISSQLHIT